MSNQLNAYENSSDAFDMDEETSLLHNKNATTYSNSDGTSQHSENAMFDFRGPSTNHVSPEDVLQRMKYAFTNEGYNVENDFDDAQALLNTLERSAFKDRVLDNLKETPMTMRERLNIRRLIYRKTHTRKRRDEELQGEKTKGSNRHFGFVPFQLWEDTISKLSAYFGSNVASYFKFMRILLFLNIFAGIIMVSFTTVPQAIVGPESYNSSTSVNQFGFLSDTMLLFGSYSDSEINGIYNQPMAYILTWICVSLFYLIVIVVAMHIRYRQSKLSDNEDDYDFALRTFCSWDHTIYSKDGTKDHTKAFCTELRERIREEKKRLKKPRLETKLLRYIGRFVSNTVVLVLLGGSGYLIYYVAHELEVDSPPEFKDLFDKYQLPGVVSLLKLIIPVIFEMIVRIEGWAPRTALKFTMIRTTIFYFASLVVFDISLHNVASKCSYSTCDNKDQNVTETCCWENRVGEEVLKVVFIDLGLCIVVGLFYDVGKAILIKCNVCCIKLELSEFAITSNVLDLIYGQGLIWLGLYFSPLIIVIGIIKLVIVFYFRLIVAKTAMVAPKKVFRASRSGNFYLFILMMTWFLCILPTAYTIVEISPSPDCGPFRKACKAYDAISKDISDLPNYLEVPLKYVGTAGVIVPVIIVLVLIALYYRAKSSSYADLIKELKIQLDFERKVEKRKVYARALSTPFGSASKATGKALQVDHEHNV